MRQVLGPGVLGRPRGIGWRGRWEGGSGWGIHVNPWLILVNVWQKPLQYCKVISLQLIKKKVFIAKAQFWMMCLVVDQCLMLPSSEGVGEIVCLLIIRGFSCRNLNYLIQYLWFNLLIALQLPLNLTRTSVILNSYIIVQSDHLCEGRERCFLVSLWP